MENIFENAINSSRQGDIGEARAILEYTKMGYVVSRTLFDSAKYDLIIDDGESLKRVQVKTSNSKDGDAYLVNLRTVISHKRISSSYRKRQYNDYDILFVLTSDNRCWSISVNDLGNAETAVSLGNKKYNEFEIK